MNKFTEQEYDVIIIGAGAAGLGNSGIANRLGLKTLLIEKGENNFGGDCTNYGCVSNKAMIHIASHFYHARQASHFGMEVDGKADMSKVLKYIHNKQDFIKDSEDAETLRKKGIDVIVGSAKFASENTIAVNGKSYKARKIFLCTGSKPRTMAIKDDKKIPIYTNETIFFDCKTLPYYLVVVGGGPIGCELGQAFSRLGSKVTMVNRGERILDKEPEQVSKILEEQFKKEGIAVLNNHGLEAVDNGNAEVTSKENIQRKQPKKTAKVYY